VLLLELFTDSGIGTMVTRHGPTSAPAGESRSVPTSVPI